MPAVRELPCPFQRSERTSALFLQVCFGTEFDLTFSAIRSLRSDRAILARNRRFLERKGLVGSNPTPSATQSGHIASVERIERKALFSAHFSDYLRPN